MHACRSTLEDPTVALGNVRWKVWHADWNERKAPGYSRRSYLHFPLNTRKDAVGPHKSRSESLIEAFDDKGKYLLGFLFVWPYVEAWNLLVIAAFGIGRGVAFCFTRLFQFAARSLLFLANFIESVGSHAGRARAWIGTARHRMASRIREWLIWRGLAYHKYADAADEADGLRGPYKTHGAAVERQQLEQEAQQLRLKLSKLDARIASLTPGKNS